MTIDEAKRIVLAKYPDAKVHHKLKRFSIEAKLNDRYKYPTFIFLCGHYKRIEKAWLSAAEKIKKEQGQ